MVVNVTRYHETEAFSVLRWLEYVENIFLIHCQQNKLVLKNVPRLNRVNFANPPPVYYVSEWYKYTQGPILNKLGSHK